MDRQKGLDGCRYLKYIPKKVEKIQALPVITKNGRLRSCEMVLS